ncbi:SagB/ThcOx family dehydrogenase [Actinomyces lilanjuaniae]|uniref:SagB/ThcOx family dehydrogenase n=1 Tax=Actinomyces lilanjuaniae TaxID=2321394 RepID=A0ABM6Z411_9ACTO|nr:SagB/ThcOx family dehydrogenase [Actinomyces lilanjuaniae]
MFVLVENVSTIDRGLYYLNPNKNCLQLVNEDARMAYACKLTGYSERISSSAVLVLLGASLRRNQWKYWERGYRTVLLDCGHLAQSIIVAAGSVGLVAHPIGGFIDDLVNEFVGYDGVDDVVLHLIALGSKGKD